MKHYGLVCVSLVLALCVCLPLSAQPNAKSVETILIDNFDVPDSQDWSWAVQASKLIYVNEEEGEVYPKMAYVPGIPNSLQLYRVEGDPDPQVLGLQVKFQRKGNNWVDLYPQKKAEDGTMTPYEVPFKGSVLQLDFWVWGANYLYYLDVLVRDTTGRVHVLPAANLNFYGWKNVVVRVPSWIPQRSRLRTAPREMTFVGFRIRTDPKEYVDDFLIYFDQVRYSSNTLSNVYDGFNLRNIDLNAVNTNGGTN